VPTSTIAIVGAGPRGTGVLERLAASAPELHPNGIEVHLVDPFPPGAGRIWRHAQSSLLAMNSMAADVTMYTDDTVVCDGPIAPGLSFWEWAQTGPVVDPDGQLVGREPAEDHRVHRADPRAREHRDRGLGHHRHVDHHAVAHADAQTGQDPGEPRDLVAELRVRVGAPGVRDGGVVDQRGLLAPARVDVPVERVVADVEPPVGEPPVEGRVGVVERAGGGDIPVDSPCCLQPEGLGVLGAGPEDVFVRTHRSASSPAVSSTLWP
jgi:hypothetical protein